MVAQPRRRLLVVRAGFESRDQVAPSAHKPVGEIWSVYKNDKAKIEYVVWIVVIVS